jgi:hypothetical protein
MCVIISINKWKAFDEKEASKAELPNSAAGRLLTPKFPLPSGSAKL